MRNGFSNLIFAKPRVFIFQDMKLHHVFRYILVLHLTNYVMPYIEL